MEKRNSVEAKKTVGYRNEAAIVQQFIEEVDLPPWVRGFSTFQIEAAKHIQQDLKDDMEHESTHHVRKSLDMLGLTPLPTEQQLEVLLQLSRGNDLAFLYFLYELNYKTPGEEEYTGNAQIVLTAIANLDMITTLRGLAEILPPAQPSKIVLERRARKNAIKRLFEREAEIKRIEFKKNKARNRYRKDAKLLPYFHRLLRPRIPPDTKIYTAQRPDFTLNLETYGSYNDPNYVPPNEENRWFATYELQTGKRIVKQVVDEEINKIFEDYNGVLLKAETIESLCHAHKKIQNLEKSLKDKLEGLKAEKCREYFDVNTIKQEALRQRILGQIEKDVEAFNWKFRQMSTNCRKHISLLAITKDIDIEHQKVKLQNLPEETPFDCHFCRPVCPCNLINEHIKPKRHTSMGERRSILRNSMSGNQNLFGNQRRETVINRLLGGLDNENTQENLLELSRKKKTTKVQLAAEESGSKSILFIKPPPTNFERRPSRVSVMAPPQSAKKECAGDHYLEDHFTAGGKKKEMVQCAEGAGLIFIEDKDIKGMGDLKSCVDQTNLKIRPFQISREEKGEGDVRNSISYKEFQRFHKQTNDRHSSISDFTKKYRNLYEEESSNFVSPKTSEHYFYPPTTHKPYLFDYQRIFRNKTNCSHNIDIKRAFVEALVNDIELLTELRAEQRLAGSQEDIPDYLNSLVTQIPSHEPVDMDTAVKKCAKRIWKESVAQRRSLQVEEEAQQVREARKSISITEKIFSKYLREYYDPKDKELMKNMLKDGLEYLAKDRKYVLPSLPYAYKLPFLLRWIAGHFGETFTKETVMAHYKNISKVFFALKNLPVQPPLPKVKQLSRKPIVDYNLRWYFKKKANYMRAKYYERLQEAVVKQCRLYWFASQPYVSQRGPQREGFYSYFPATPRDVQKFPWKSNECRDMKISWGRRRALIRRDRYHPYIYLRKSLI